MKELIKITQKEGKQAVSARELYDFIGYDKSQWSRWYQTNIINDKFAVENVDYQTLDIMSNGNMTKDFAITISFAKEICMLARTEKGKEARLYFIECEKMLKNKFEIPQTYSQALMLAAKQAEQIEQQNKLIEVKDTQILELKPKATYYDTILSSKKAECISVFSKSDYGISGMAMNKLLHDWGIQYKVGKTWLPYQKYASLGYTKTETVSVNNGEDTAIHTKWTQQGRLFIYEEMKKHGYLPLIEK